MTDPQRSLSRNMLLMGSGILVSRVLGLARDIAFAERWGTDQAFAAFIIAFTIPNLLRALFGEGAFAAAFVPVLAARMEQDGRGAAWRAARQIISVLAVLLAVIVAVVMVMSGAARAVVAAGPSERAALYTFMLALLVRLMPYAWLVCLSGAFAGVLHSIKRFAVPALSPLLLNVCLIGAAVWVAPALGRTPETQVMVLAAAVLIAGVLQLGVHAAACRANGFRFRFMPAWKAPDVRRVAWLMAPALIGTGVAQVNVAVDRLLAGWLGDVATGSLYYSQRLVYLPVSLFGVAMAMVSLPVMARAWSRADRESMRGSLHYALRHVLFLSVPAAVLLAVCGRAVIQLLFEHGSFGAESTRETFWALSFYLPGLPAFAAAKIAVTMFHARQDTRTPVRIAAVCLVLNVVLNLTLMWSLRQGGLALATTICSYLNVALLLHVGARGVDGLKLRSLLPSLRRIGGSAAAAGLAAAAANCWWTAAVTRTGFAARVTAVLLPLGVGAAAYATTAWLLHAPELRELTEAVSGWLPRLRGNRK